MTNWQKYEKEIQKAVSEVLTFDRETKSFCICDENNSFNPPCECFNCYFKGTEERSRAFLKWANAEAKEEILISEDERNVLQAMYNQGFRYLARDSKKNTLSVFTQIPINVSVDQYDWVTLEGEAEESSIFKKMFPFLTPKQPLGIKHLLDCAVIKENLTTERERKHEELGETF